MSSRRPLVILVLSLMLGLAPVASQAAPLALPRVPSLDFESVLEGAWSGIQSFMSKLLTAGGTGDDGGTTSSTPTTPSTGSGTGTPTTGGDNGPGIDPNG